MEFDTIVTNGIIVSSGNCSLKVVDLIFSQANANDVVIGQDIGIKDGVITCIGASLQASSSTTIIDAQGAYITPGGIDSHVHLQQQNAPTGDTWETGTRSAICGGTTTVIAFASQRRQDESIIPVVADYSALAEGNCACDYGIHLILTNPTKDIVQKELPLMVEAGITSVKLYMTYDPLKLRDREILDVMVATRKLGMTTMIHAENHDMIQL